MTDIKFNKFRAAAGVLLHSRDLLVDSMADEILEQSEELLAGSYVLHELLENHGTRIHFLSLLVAQLEQSAEEFDERHAAAKAAMASTKPRSKKPRTKSKPVAESPPSRGKTSRPAEREAPPEDA